MRLPRSSFPAVPAAQIPLCLERTEVPGTGVPLVSAVLRAHSFRCPGMILPLCWPVVCLLLPHGLWHPGPVSSLCLARGGCAVWTGQPGLGPTHLLPCLWQACTSSHSLCSNLSSTWSLSEFPSPLGGPEAPGEAGGSEPHTSVRGLLPQIQGSLGISYVANTHSAPSLPTI